MDGSAPEMAWYRRLQFVSAVPMPQELADAYGTTVNGMWASPEARTASELAEAHARGRRALFSVPMIALTPEVYETAEHRYLLRESCADAFGDRAVVDWYYWEGKPVYSACIYSDAFRAYLMARCCDGVDRGFDVVNLDEINTSIGLMNREPGGSGFCAACLARFRARAAAGGDAEIVGTGDEALRLRLRADDDLYLRYRGFHEREAHATVLGFIRELRDYARTRNRGFAITANLAYLGNNVPEMGVLWGPMWGPSLDFVMMENMYRIGRDGPHLLPPRGTFTAWYRLGAALAGGAPNWICPSILVPRQMAGQERARYYEFMFLEAYANGGRWGYYWWPGVDVETRRRATAPEALKDWTRFLTLHRTRYEEAVADNRLAIAYLDGAIGAEPETHVKYLALAQVLAELGYQFDVLYVGDGVYASDRLEPERLARYETLLLPEAGSLSEPVKRTLAGFASGGSRIVTFSASPLDAELVRREDGELLDAIWREYRPEDRERLAAVAEGFGGLRVRCSDPHVAAIRYLHGTERVLHLLDYAYDEATDTVTPSRDLRVAMPWPGPEPTCTMLDLDGERPLTSNLEDGELTIEVPELTLYALVVLR